MTTDAGAPVSPELEADPTKPDVKRAAARVRARRVPRSPEERKTYERERKRRQRANVPAREELEEGERPPYEPDPTTIAFVSIGAAAIWKLSTLVTGHRELSAEEARELGTAVDPVLYKYCPWLEDWAAELNLAACLFALWEATKPPAKPEEKPTEYVVGGDAPAPA